MKKKSLVVGTIVLLLTAVVFLGCPTETKDPETNTVTDTVDVLGTVVSVAELKAIVANETAGTYALLSNSVSATALGGTDLTEIPAGVILNLYGEFTIQSGGLEIGGTVNVTKGSELKGDQDIKIGKGNGSSGTDAAGALNIKSGGTLTTALTNLKPTKGVTAGVADTWATIGVAELAAANWTNGTWSKTDEVLSGVVLHFDDGAIYGGTVTANATSTATTGEWTTTLGLAASTQPAFAVISVGTGIDFSAGTGNLVVAKGAGLTFTGAVTSFGTNTITVDEGGTLTIGAGAATLATTGDITVNGTLDIGASAIAVAPVADVVVGPRGKINLASSATLSTTAGHTLTINGKVTAPLLELSGVTLGSTTGSGATAKITAASNSTLELVAKTAEFSPAIGFAPGGYIKDRTSSKFWSVESNGAAGTLVYTSVTNDKKVTLGNGTIVTNESAIVATAGSEAGVITFTGNAGIVIPGTTGALALDKVIVDLTGGGTISIANTGALTLKQASGGTGGTPAGVIVTSASTGATGIVAGKATTDVVAGAGGVATILSGGSLAAADATITGGSSTNNLIDANDTFSAASAVITVVHN
ncbi:hypothetical protein FACS1894110_05690 [Spirochaetia bacterium]|nr:hypothetical protein FACS1894110_05690 [Spirochaetia bacterium]